MTSPDQVYPALGWATTASDDELAHCHGSGAIPELVQNCLECDCAMNEVVLSVPWVGKPERLQLLKLFCDIRTVF